MQLSTKKVRTLLLSAWVCACLLPWPGYAAQSPAQNNSLIETEQMAENLVDTFVHNDFGTAEKTVAAIRGRFRDMHKELASKPFNERKERELAMMHAWLRIIVVAIHNRSGIGGAIAANQLTAALMRNRDFPDTAQSSIAWLDYLGREIVLLNMEDPQANANLLALRRNDITMTWNHLRDMLLLKDFRNKSITMNVDHLVQRMNPPRDPTSQIADGKELRHWMERLKQLPDAQK